ncbi:MAG TPA: ABC transporter permease [Candidatus Dormibacteraeota bacterium]|nr:ABC transporter permease [Candidatus Dormibacteraeota bacterium]
MKTRDMAELAVRNLREALLRNSLTTVGIAVGVASLVAMLSLGAGLQHLANQRLAQSGLFDAVLVSPKNSFSDFARAATRGQTLGTPRPLDESARNEIAKLPHVAQVYPNIRFPTEIHFNGNPYPTMVAGIPMSDRNDGSFDGMTGSFFSSPMADEAIVQIELARELIPDAAKNPESLLGKEVTLRYAERQSLAPTGAGQSGGTAEPGFSLVPHQMKLRIVGVVQTEPASGFAGPGQGRLLIPEQVAEQLSAAQTSDLRQLLSGDGAAGQKTYQSLTVRVASTSDVSNVDSAIKDMGFSAFSILDAARSLRIVFAVFDLLLGIFGSLALIVASLGIINTLVMAILERRREIGVLKALGAADRDIRGLFFAEAGVMGLVGGIFGVLFGWLIGRAINLGTNIYLARQSLPATTISLVPWWMVGSAIAFAVVVSLAAGIYPASRAAKLNPIEALRYE